MLLGAPGVNGAAQSFLDAVAGTSRRLHDRLLKPLDVALRVEEPVDVIQSQARELPLADEAEHQTVCRGEYGLVLHAQAGKVVDVEKTAIVDLVQRRLPVGQPIRQRLEELVKAIERFRFARL